MLLTGLHIKRSVNACVLLPKTAQQQGTDRVPKHSAVTGLFLIRDIIGRPCQPVSNAMDGTKFLFA